MKNAIEKAIEGKYGNLHYLDTQTEWQGQYKILLDPLFWQCLGKSLELDGSTYCWQKDQEEKWLTLWHRFIDYIADGEYDVDGFFNNLINK